MELIGEDGKIYRVASEGFPDIDQEALRQATEKKLAWWMTDMVNGNLQTAFGTPAESKKAVQDLVTQELIKFGKETRENLDRIPKANLKPERRGGPGTKYYRKYKTGGSF